VVTSRNWRKDVLVKKCGVLNNRGFTIIELTASLVIIGVLASVAVHKYHVIESAAEIQAIGAGVRELNTREMLTWMDAKLSLSGYPGDELLFGLISKDLGPDYRWDSDPGVEGGSIQFATESLVLRRTASDVTSPGRWQ